MQTMESVKLKKDKKQMEITSDIHSRLAIIKAKFNLRTLSDAAMFLLDFYEEKKAEDLKEIDLD